MEKGQWRLMGEGGGGERKENATTLTWRLMEAEGHIPRYTKEHSGLSLLQGFDQTALMHN